MSELLNGAGAGAVLIGGHQPRVEELKLVVTDGRGQAYPCKLGPGVGLALDQTGNPALVATKPLTATVVGQAAVKQDDGTYLLPIPIPDKSPTRLTGHRVFSSGVCMSPGKHYTITASAEDGHRILPAAGFLSFFNDEVIADYVATY
jgi:hypothetical protein